MGLEISFKNSTYPFFCFVSWADLHSYDLKSKLLEISSMLYVFAIEFVTRRNFRSNVVCRCRSRLELGLSSSRVQLAPNLVDVAAGAISMEIAVVFMFLIVYSPSF